MKLFEINSNASFWLLLTEDARTDFILKTYGNKLQNIQHDRQAQGQPPEEIVNKLAQIDPTNNRQYLQFLAKMYTAGQFRLEDANRIKKYLTIFNNVKPQLPVEQRDIMRIKRLPDLYRIAQQYEDKPEPQSQRQIKKQTKTEGVNVIIDTPNFKVLDVQTEEAACLYGKGTQWCTAGDKDNMFKHYKDKGNLYIIIAGNRKFQIHMEEDQFMDEQDQNILEKAENGGEDDIAYLSKFPEYTKFLNMLIKKYYGA